MLTWALLDLQMLEKEVSKPGEEEAIAGNLSREELERLNSFTLNKRKREWLGGRFAAKYVAQQLLQQVGYPKNFLPWSSHSILADENGRPFLSVTGEKTTRHCDISISHSESMAAAMAVHKGYCGIDIQKVTPKVIKVRDRFCSLGEKTILDNFFPVGPEQQATPLTRLWTAKEALRKVSGLRMLPGFLDLELIEITADPLQKNSGPWGFVFNWKNSGGIAHKKCIVTINHADDYAMALTARSDNAD